jgi:hypothetical protein
MLRSLAFVVDWRRMPPSSKAFPTPPRDWKDIAIRLAEERVWRYQKLIENIRSDSHGEK